MDEFVIKPETIGMFNYKGTDLRIWASIRNQTENLNRIKQWQFRYDPLFKPHRKPNGTLVIRKTKLPMGYQVQLPIILYDIESNRVAYENVVELFGPDTANEIRSANVTALPITSISYKIDQLKLQVPEAVLETENGKQIPLFASEPIFNVTIYTATEAQADQVIAVLPNLRIEYTITFSAKTQAQNFIKIKRSDLKQSSLFAKLNGLGTTQTFVHRDDLRQLVEGISSKIEVNGFIEDPTEFDATLVKEVIANMSAEVNADLTSFDDQKWNSTYNGDDLKPDVITHELNKMFTKHEAEDQWKYNISFAASSKANVIDLLSGEASAQGSYNEEGLKKLLDEHNIETQFEGNKIVTKSIDLQQFNMSDFESNQEFTTIMTFVSNLKDPNQGSLDLSLAVTPETTTPGLLERMAELEKIQFLIAPVGTILPYGGEMESLSNNHIQNWKLCNGEALSRVQYESLFKAIGFSWGGSEDTFNLPNLQGYFLRGKDGEAGIDPDKETRTALVPGGNTGNKVGSIQNDAFANHEHNQRRNKYVGAGIGAWGFAGYAFDSEMDNWGSTGGSGGSETRPKNAYINYIIRVK